MGIFFSVVDGIKREIQVTILSQRILSICVIHHMSRCRAVLPQARLGNWLVSRLISILYGVPLHDIGSFRAVRCSVLVALEMREMTYGWPVEMVVKAARAHYRIVEVPIHYRHRSHGRSKVAGTITGSMKAAFSMVRTTLRYAGTRRTHA